MTVWRERSPSGRSRELLAHVQDILAKYIDPEPWSEAEVVTSAGKSQILAAAAQLR